MSTKSKKEQRANVRVVCRVRPQNALEKSKSGSLCVALAKTTIDLELGAQETQKFTFDRVFGPETTQIEVFEYVAKPLINEVLNGFNGTIFAYGQTSSGKTHTMQGPSITDPETRGIIPRSIGQIFEGVLNAPETVEFTVKVGFIEIYMERIRDLLDMTKQNLAVRQNPQRGVYVEGVTEEYVSCEADMLELMEEAAANRVVSATGMNAGSSRSHSVAMISIRQRDTVSQAQKAGGLYLVDLAGSETVRKTGASGQTLEEAKMINRSLSALGNVINALTDPKNKGHIPYRDSKLTRVLQESLGGNARTSLIIACSPSSFNAQQTLSTLRFGQRAKSIKNKAKQNAQRSVAELTKLLKQAERAIDLQQAYIASLEGNAALLEDTLEQHNIPSPLDGSETGSSSEEEEEEDGGAQGVKGGEAPAAQLSASAADATTAAAAATAPDVVSPAAVSVQVGEGSDNAAAGAAAQQQADAAEAAGAGDGDGDGDGAGEAKRSVSGTHHTHRRRSEPRGSFVSSVALIDLTQQLNAARAELASVREDLAARDEEAQALSRVIEERAAGAAEDIAQAVRAAVEREKEAQAAQRAAASASQSNTLTLQLEKLRFESREASLGMERLRAQNLQLQRDLDEQQLPSGSEVAATVRRLRAENNRMARALREGGGSGEATVTTPGSEAAEAGAALTAPATPVTVAAAAAAAAAAVAGLNARGGGGSSGGGSVASSSEYVQVPHPGAAAVPISDSDTDDAAAAAAAPTTPAAASRVNRSAESQQAESESDPATPVAAAAAAAATPSPAAAAAATFRSAVAATRLAAASAMSAVAAAPATDRIAAAIHDAATAAAEAEERGSGGGASTGGGVAVDAVAAAAPPLSRRGDDEPEMDAEGLRARLGEVRAQWGDDRQTQAAIRADIESQRAGSEADLQRLTADLHNRCEKVIELEVELDRERARSRTLSPERDPGLSPDTRRHRMQISSLQQRLEQLVSVHRQLLRKYATLELEKSEAGKKLGLAAQRIAQLDSNATNLARSLRAQGERFARDKARLVAEHEQETTQLQHALAAWAAGGMRGGGGGGGRRRGSTMDAAAEEEAEAAYAEDAAAIAAASGGSATRARGASIVSDPEVAYAASMAAAVSARRGSNGLSAAEKHAARRHGKIVKPIRGGGRMAATSGGHAAAAAGAAVNRDTTLPPPRFATGRMEQHKRDNSASGFFRRLSFF